MRLPDFSDPVIDTLTTANSRLVITEVNTFKMIFPAAITSAYVFSDTSSTKDFIYGLEVTSNSKTVRAFEGTITLKREQTK